MKTVHALSLVSLLVGGTVFGAASFTGCSSNSDSGGSTPATETGTPPTDSAADTAKPPGDSAKPDGVVPPSDTKPTVCDQTLASDFKCVAPKVVAGSTACSEAMLQDFAEKCLSADLKVPATCAAWKSANAACNTCVEAFSIDPASIPGKVIPDRDKCYYDVFDAKCSLAVACYFDCGSAVCTDCDQTKGSGTKATTSEYDDCWSRVHFAGSASRPKGQCYDIASKTAKTECFSGPFDINPCIINELYSPTGAGGKIDLPTLKTEVTIFLRGACRDNANWTNSSSGGDAGVTDSASGG